MRDTCAHARHLSSHAYSLRSTFCRCRTAAGYRFLPGDLYEVMLSDATVDLLFDSGFLNTLNTRFGLLFDHYEDESITRPEQLQYARALLRDLQLGRKCQSIDPLDIAFGLALEKMTGIYFQL